MTDTTTDTFEKLAEKLTDAEKVTFLRVLNKNGITVESDTVLSKFFLTLQIYVSLYEKVPKSIHTATTWFQAAIKDAVADFKKPVSDVTLLKTEIERLTKQTKQSAENAEASRLSITQELERVDESLENINASIAKGTEKAATTVSERLTELLSAAMKKALPLSDLEKAGEIFLDAVHESEQASAELRENVETARQARFRTLAVGFALTFIFAVLGTGIGFYFWSEHRIEEARFYYVRLISGNNEVISELAESKRELRIVPITDDPKKKGYKRLVMNNALDAWQSTSGNGVIEFK